MQGVFLTAHEYRLDRQQGGDSEEYNRADPSKGQGKTYVRWRRTGVFRGANDPDGDGSEKSKADEAFI